MPTNPTPPSPPPPDAGLVFACLDACAQSYAPASSAITLSASHTDTHAVLIPAPSHLTVAFRGTADLRNWLTDLHCALVPLSPGGPRVHAGFLHAWLSLKPILLACLSSLPPGNANLVFTGHSLGGALALLAALDLTIHPSNLVNLVNPVQKNPFIQSCLTFGQPRVGDAHFALLYDATLRDRTCRFVNSDDIVPRVPWLLGAYRHAGHEIFLPAKNRSAILDPSIWAKLPSDLSSLTRALAYGKLACLEHHHLPAYLNRLSATPASLLSPARSKTLNLEL